MMIAAHTAAQEVKPLKIRGIGYCSLIDNSFKHYDRVFSMQYINHLRIKNWRMNIVGN
jgi:hypothetical protein